MRNKGFGLGFTLLELIIAISVSGIVLTLLLAVFTDVGKWFALQNVRADTVRKMLITKKKIDRELFKMDYIHSWSAERVTFGINSYDSSIVVDVRNGVMHRNTEQICSGLKKFEFEFYQNKILFWESELESGGWIGGAVVLDE